VLHGHSQEHHNKPNYYLNLSKLNLSKKYREIYEIHNIKTNNKQVLITFSKYQQTDNTNTNINNKNNMNNNNKKSTKKNKEELSSSAGLDPGQKCIAVVTTSDNYQYKLSQKEYYERSNLNQLRNRIDKLKKHHFYYVQQIENSFSLKKTYSSHLLSNINSYFNNYNELYNFYNQSSILNLKFKSNMRKKSVISDFVDTIKRSLLFKTKCDKGNNRYSYQKTSKNYVKNKNEKRVKNKLIDPNNNKSKTSNIALFYGGAKMPKTFKYNQSTPQLKLFHIFDNTIKTYLTSEYFTSQKCPECFCFFSDREGRYACCKNKLCISAFTPIDRDVSASKNILINGKHYYCNNEYHREFKPQ